MVVMEEVAGTPVTITADAVNQATPAIQWVHSLTAAVAQLVVAPDCGSGCRGFKSLQPPQLKIWSLPLPRGLRNRAVPAGRASSSLVIYLIPLPRANIAHPALNLALKWTRDSLLDLGDEVKPASKVPEEQWISVVKAKVSQITQHLVSVFCDLAFLALWAAGNFYADKFAESMSVRGIGVVERECLEAVFGVATLAPLAIFLYKDVRIMLIRANREIKAEAAGSIANPPEKSLASPAPKPNSPKPPKKQQSQKLGRHRR